MSNQIDNLNLGGVTTMASTGYFTSLWVGQAAASFNYADGVDDAGIKGDLEVQGTHYPIGGTDTQGGAHDWRVIDGTGNAFRMRGTYSGTVANYLKADTSAQDMSTDVPWDFDNTIDLDAALTAAGAGIDSDVTVNNATAQVHGLDASVTQLTTGRSGGLAAALMGRTTSIAGDTGGIYACLAGAATDGGGTTTHAMLYSADAMDAFAIADASGDMGITVSADGMTKNPESDTEDGYITIKAGGTTYQVPIYAA